MTGSFDPYHKWLAIPPDEQPPNHYRLLGVRTFENDPDVIEAAADQRMAHLRTYQAGRHGELSQKLLNEMAAAKLCLLQPEQKASYDLELGLGLEAEPDRPVPVGPAAEPAPGIEPSAPRLSRAKSSRANLVKVVAVGGGAALLLLIVLVWSFSSSGEAVLSLNWPEEQRDGAKLEIDGRPVTVAVAGLIEHRIQPGEHRIVATRPGFEPFEWRGAVDRGGSYPIEPVWRKSRPAPPPPKVAATPNDDQRKKPNESVPDPSDPPVKPPPVDPPTVAEDPPEAGTNEPQPEPVAVEDPGTSEPQPTEEAAAKPAIPSGDVQAKLLEQFEEVYELGKPRSGEEKLDLAGELLALGGKAEDLGERFVLLRKAMELSAAGGDAAAMVDAIDAIGETFQIDALAVKQKMLVKFAGTAKDTESIGSFVAASAALIDEAAATERYELALSMATLAYRTSQHTAGRKYRKETFDLRQRVQKLFDQQQKLASMLAAVEADPDDGAANLFLGQMYCFTRGDWPRGLPYLAKCDDASLSAAAQQELAAPTDPAEQIKLADAWYDLAQSAKKNDAKTAILLHAGSWYERAQPKIASALRKVKVSRRLEEIAKIERPSTQVASARRRTVVRRIYFRSPDVLRSFTCPTPRHTKWNVSQGQLLIQATRGDREYVTYGEYFRKISSVTIRGGIVPPSKYNFRVGVGPIWMIINWEIQNENHFRAGGIKRTDAPKTVTSPGVFIPGRIHEIRVVQNGEKVVVTIDGKQHYAATATLEGTIAIYTAHGSTIAVQEIVIEGEPDPNRVVVGPSHVKRGGPARRPTRKR